VAKGGAPQVQVFGRKDSRETQKALRFFKERSVPVSFVDIAIRPPAPTELRRFAARVGAPALLDRDGKAYQEQGLGWMVMGPEEILERVLAAPALLRLPLVRLRDTFAVGVDETAWKGMVAALKVAP
jgi:arsenate reductase (glutaredoxin)